jgi:cephalosporin hydroxylase
LEVSSTRGVVTKRLVIDFESGELLEETDAGSVRHGLDTPAGFALLSRAWLRSGWQNRHVYTFTWLGRPIIQLPEDMFRVQEVLHGLRPDVIVDVGVAHGGSLVFYAGLCRLLGRGRVIGVDVEIRPRNRAALEAHPLADLLTLVEGDSVAPGIVDKVRAEIRPGERVFVMLDGDHTRAHVLAELEAYAPLVTPGSWIVAADGIMADLAGLRRWRDPRRTEDWSWNNPRAAAEEFAARHPEFALETPPFAFNESPLREPVTYWPGAWLRRTEERGER